MFWPELFRLGIRKVRNKKGCAIHNQSERLYTVNMIGQMEYNFAENPNGLNLSAHRPNMTFQGLEAKSIKLLSKYLHAWPWHGCIIVPNGGGLNLCHNIYFTVFWDINSYYSIRMIGKYRRTFLRTLLRCRPTPIMCIMTQTTRDTHR